VTEIYRHEFSQISPMCVKYMKSSQNVRKSFSIRKCTQKVSQVSQFENVRKSFSNLKMYAKADQFNCTRKFLKFLNAKMYAKVFSIRKCTQSVRELKSD